MCQILWPQPHDKIQTTWKFIVLFKINRTKIRKRTLLKHQPIKKNLRLTMNKKKYSGKVKNTRIRKFVKHDTKKSSNSCFCCQYPWCDVRNLYPFLFYFYKMKRIMRLHIPQYSFSSNIVYWVWVGCRNDNFPNKFRLLENLLCCLHSHYMTKKLFH